MHHNKVMNIYFLSHSTNAVSVTITKRLTMLRKKINIFF